MRDNRRRISSSSSSSRSPSPTRGGGRRPLLAATPLSSSSGRGTSRKGSVQKSSTLYSSSSSEEGEYQPQRPPFAKNGSTDSERMARVLHFPANSRSQVRFISFVDLTYSAVHISLRWFIFPPFGSRREFHTTSLREISTSE